ncbi:MAG TPA: cytochrome c3 family protein [Labilithrix sp.]
MKKLALLVLALLLASCAGILGIRPKETAIAGPHPFEHHEHLVKGVACVQCHVGIVAAGDDGPLHVPDAATCTGCHAQPHDARPCGTCHGFEPTRDRAAQAKAALKFEHRTHSGPTSGQCVRCHVNAGDAQPAAMLPPMGACLGCHEHESEFAVRTCDRCHTDLPAERVKPESHVVHEGDFVREHGIRAASSRDLCATCHAQRFCDGCHGRTTPALPAKLAFDAPRLEGLHRAGFRSRHAEEARGQPGLCSTCHTIDSCRECHSREGVSATGRGTRGPHPAGWLLPSRGGGDHGSAARVDPASCAGCHGGAGEALCVGCHRVGGPGGNPHGPGFASNRSKTRDRPCRACHGAGP